MISACARVRDSTSPLSTSIWSARVFTMRVSLPWLAIAAASDYRKLPSFCRNAIAHLLSRITLNPWDRDRMACPKAPNGHAPDLEERGFGEGETLWVVSHRMIPSSRRS
jgi:hypothetical protein